MKDDQNNAAARLTVAKLRIEHDDYHAAIEAMIAQKCDQMRIQRLKKKKLELKDRIRKVASSIIPDMPA